MKLRYLGVKEMVSGFSLKDAIVEALSALGGSGTASEVRDYIKSKYGKDWKDIETIMYDLCQESQSSFFPREDKMLTKIGQGKYSIKTEVTVTEPRQIAVEIDKPKPTAGDVAHTAAKVARSGRVWRRCRLAAGGAWRMHHHRGIGPTNTARTTRSTRKTEAVLRQHRPVGGRERTEAGPRSDAVHRQYADDRQLPRRGGVAWSRGDARPQ